MRCYALTNRKAVQSRACHEFLINAHNAWITLSCRSVLETGRSKRQKHLEAAKCQKEEYSQPEEHLSPSEHATWCSPTANDAGFFSVRVDESDLVEVYARDWIDGLDLMSLSIALHRLLVTVLQPPSSSLSLPGKERELFRKGDVPSLLITDTLQGKYQRSGVLWQNEQLNKLATRYVRENKAVKGKRHGWIKLSYLIIVSSRDIHEKWAARLPGNGCTN